MNMNRLILTLLCGALLVGGTACSGDDPQPSDKPQPENPGGTDTPDTPGLPTYPKPDRSQIAAFPGAHGAGRYVKGGAEGKVYVVTSLKDDNPVYVNGRPVPRNMACNLKPGDKIRMGETEMTFQLM